MTTPRLLLALVALGLPACAYIPEDDIDWRLDPDGDGVESGIDCDDNDPAIGGPTTWYVDSDGDGYGDPDNVEEACEQPPGTSRQGLDCDDSESSAHPGATEQWYDGIDQDCDGNDDDQDLDGEAAVEAGGPDCDDLDDEINTSAEEIWYDGTDQDCDGNDRDQDGDGYDVDSDCDDEDPERYPDSGDVPEVYFNGIDDNCNLIDGDGDSDSDGYWADDYAGRVVSNGGTPLDVPAEWAGDCWDADPTDFTRPVDMTAINGFADPQPQDVYPGAADVFYDGIDQDCAGEDANGDGAPDEFDADLDAFTSDEWPDRSGALGEDCDDSDEAVNPGAFEIYYDGADQNCDDLSDYDADGDFEDSEEYGGADCDDTNGDVYPGQLEICNDGIDNDCDDEAPDCTPSGDIDLSTSAELRIDGDTASAAFGYTMGSGDLNGDGTTDLIGGAYNWYSSSQGATTGAAFVFLGPISADTDTSQADAMVEGDTGYTYLSYGDAALMDADGDGYDDILVGAYASGDGAVAVIYGPITGAVDFDDADVLLLGVDGETAYDVSAGGDLDGDARPDIVVTANGNDDFYVDGGAAHIFSDVAAMSGRNETVDATYTLYGPNTAVELGTDVAPLADLDGDGVHDLIVGSNPQGWGGGVFIVSGPITSSEFIDDVGILLKSEDGSDSAGSALSTPTDLNDDGYLDLLIGVQGYDTGVATNAGGAYVVRGPFTASQSLSSAAAFYQGSDTSDYAGSKVEVIGDVDGDGELDLAIGAQAAELSASGQGITYMLLGPHTGTSALSDAQARFHGGTSSDAAGQGLAPAGDQNGDGYDDLFIGAYGVDAAIGNAGAIYLVIGGGI